MDRLRGLFRRVLAMVRRRAADEDLRDELEFHTAMETERLMREGAEPTAARRAALVSFGGVDRYGEAARDERRIVWLDDARQDLRHAARLVRRDLRFSSAVVLTLALGIGATTAIFSVVDAVLLRAGPFADVDRLVMIWETDRASGTSHEPASWPDVVDMRERSRMVEGVGTLLARERTVTTDGAAASISTMAVTPNVPELLGVRPVIGSLFDGSDAGGEAVPQALLSESFWRTRYDAAADVLGTTLVIGGEPVEIIGVVPRDADLGLAQIHARADYSARFGGPVDVWVAFEPTAATYPRQTHPFLTIGRMRQAATLPDVQRELSTIMADLERDYPENAARGVNVEPYMHVTFGPVRQALLVLLGGVVVVLLVACVNVANLLLARTAHRARELAVRRALGASTGRMNRQFLMESLLLTLLGVAGGLLLAVAGVRGLTLLAPEDIPRIANVTLDLRVLAVATLVSITVCVLFGLAPLLESRHVQPHGVLKSQPGRTATASRETRRFRDALVIAQVALAVALVIAGGLLVRSFIYLNAVDPGFRTSDVITAEYRLEPASRYPMGFDRWPALTEVNTFHATFLERVRALPGVRHAALAASGPLDPGITNSFSIVGREAESADLPEIRTRFISDGYLGTLDVPLTAGRDFIAADLAGAQPVAMINAAAARRYFDGIDPIDQTLSFWGIGWRIVGIIGNEKFGGIDADADPAVYVPLAQAPQATATVLVQTAATPSAAVSDLRRTLGDLDPGLALANAETLENGLGATVARPRFVAVLLGSFAALALLLALIGVHGVLSYNVAQRTAEIGIRLALGSTRGGVLLLILRRGILLAAAGTALGLIASAATAGAMRSLLFGIQPYDALTFTAATAGVLLLALLASLVPALHAARGQPMHALRSD